MSTLLTLAFIFIRCVWGLSSTNVELDYANYTGVKTDVYYAFRGVRYANNPTGNLRWRAPISPPTVKLGNVDASKFRNACISGGQKSVSSGSSEDCLFGNIYVPITDSTELLPVMIWFHGGGLQSGAGTADPQYLIKSSTQPMIFVAFNYRLAQFGFLGGTKIHDNGDLNVGLLDQRAAINWVNKYISKFGGDPSRVTIFGESAGGGSVMFQLIGNGGNNNNLFRGAIGDSPSLSFTPDYNDAFIDGLFQEYATNAGCGTAADVMACLRSADVNVLAAAGPKTTANHPSTIYLFAPVVGGSFILNRPVESFTSGAFAKVPMLFGSNTNEGFGWSNGIPDPSANTSEPNANEDTVFNFLAGQWHNLDRDTFNKLANLYPLSSYQNSVKLQGEQMYGENRYICSANVIVAQGHRAGLRTYQYRYDNPSGSTHGAELAAFFNAPGTGNTAQDHLFEEMRQYWTSFVTGGVPVSANGVTWTTVSDDVGNNRLVLHPDALQFERMPDQINRCIAWHNTGLKMGI